MHAHPLENGGEPSPSNALVVSSDKPTRLETALAAFQNVLTADERKMLRAEMSVSRDASQVIAFTAGLDLVDPNRRGRSIATRLHSILQTVQQFSQVVDTYVSSHPEIAALVWGSVRLAFTVLANFTSFFQTFSDLLNGFDTLTPQFKEYQILFPDSLPLRNSVYDFHSAIISCCTQVISSTRKTWSQKAWASITSSFESEIRPRVAEIREKAELVKGQAALAKAQDDSRRQANLAAELQLREKERKWNSLLLKLFPFNHESAFIQARAKIHRGTAEWIFSTRDFQDWCEIGAGKTILAASVVSRLLQKLTPNCSISYLFIRSDDENSRSTDMILRSLIFQALTGHEVRSSLMEMLEKSAYNGFERSSLLSLLGRSISLLEKTFLVIDGLDQCSPEEQNSLLQSISQVMRRCNRRGGVKVLISARESMAKEVDRALAPTQHLRIGLTDTNADLARYAEEILADKQDRGELVVRDETIMKEIVDKLQTGGEGMFLWVFLTIEDICSCPTDRDIRKTLEVLPRKLSHTFNRALGRILSSQSSSIVELVQRTFRWAATARRPMTRWELGEALGVKILQKSSIKDQIINGTERLPGWCENLIHIEAGDETIRFFHHSIKTHLLDTKLNATELGVFYIDPKAWDHYVGEICLTYLNFSDFERALTDFPTDYNKLYIRQIAMSDEGRNIPAAIGNEAILNALPDTGRHRAVRFLRRYLKPKKSGESFSVPKCVSKPAEMPSEGGAEFSDFFSIYPFLLYATNFWFHHTFRFHPSKSKTWRLWEEQVMKSMLEDDKSWPNFGQEPPGFETFDRKRRLTSQSNAPVAVSNISASDRKKFDAERTLLHKAIIFADFIGHRALLTHVLTTVKDRGHTLSPKILELLLPTRRVFQFPREREGYIKDVNSHDGMVSLVTEFIACGGRVWPCNPVPQQFSVCNDTCAGKPLHMDMAKIISRSGYIRDEQPWLHLFAKIVVLNLTKETSDAIESWVKSPNPCIHEVRTMDNRDIIDTILEIGGSSSFKFAHWVLGLHQNCVGGRKYEIDDWRGRLQKAIRKPNMIAVEFYLQESNIALAEEKEYSCIDYGLLGGIVAGWPLPHDLRSQAIAIAIPKAAEAEKRRACGAFRESVILGNWDIAVALSSRGFKLASTVPSAAEKRSWFQALDDVLSCVSQTATSRCTQGWVTLENKTKPTLELCVRHKSEAKKAWSAPYPQGGDMERQTFESLHALVRKARRRRA